MSEIRRFRHAKSFEQIPRELLQSTELTYEAIGLLCQLESHSDDYKIYKTQLYHRSKKNSRHKVDKIWKELEESGFLLSFKKREGKKYVYRYITSVIKFTKEEVEQLCEEYSCEGYTCVNHNKTFVEETKESLTEAENFGMLKYNSPKNSVKSTNFELLNFDIPNSAVENQHVIYKNKNIKNKIFSDSYDSERADKKITNSQIEPKINTQIVIEQTNLDEFMAEKTDYHILSAYKLNHTGLREDVLQTILTYSPDEEITETIISQLFKAKANVSKDERIYPIRFEQLKHEDFEQLKQTIKTTFRLMYSSVQKRKIQNKEAYWFSAFKEFFYSIADITEIYKRECEESLVSEDILEFFGKEKEG